MLRWAFLPLVWILGHCQAAAYAQAVTVQGGGATLPLTLYLNALFSYRFVEPNVEIEFASSTTDQALCRLTNSSRECAAGDTAPPLSLDWGSAVSLPKVAYYARYPDLQLYPTVASAVVPIYNLNGVSGLVLTMAALAKIWSGRITTWDHPDIQATNPNFASWNIPASQPIILVARADSVGTTQVFKKALAGVDAVFLATVGTASAAVWNGTQPVLQSGLQLQISYVLCHPYTLGYAVLGDAMANAVPTAQLNRSGVVVAASAASVQYAMLELGLAFGNNGDDKSHLTADLYNALNPLAWPITSYAYLAVRKSTLRPGATCATVSAMVNFWLWFWTDSQVETLATSLGFSVLPQVVQDVIVNRFTSDLLCEGRVVYQAAEKTDITGYGPASAIPIFDQLQQAYEVVNHSIELNYSTIPAAADVNALLQAGGFVVSPSPLSATTDTVSLIFAGEALAAVSQFVLTLDLPTLAKILNGDIQTWQHSSIAALNPAGVTDSSGRPLNGTAQRIVLLQGPTSVSDPLAAVLRQAYPAYTGAAIQAAPAYPNEVVLRSMVLGTPGAFSVTSLVGTLPVELQVAALRPPGGGPAVAPSLASVQTCASTDVYAAATNTLNLAASSNPGCYPLSLTLYLNVRRRCVPGQPTPAAATATTVAFVQWLYSASSGLTLNAALEELNVAPFQQAFSAVELANDEALFQLSCQVRATPTNIVPLLLAVIIPIVAVVLLGVAGCGWWLWRVTENNRVLRQKFSNDNVAESCAEAIARFDLQSVAWLREVPEPNKIQRAFLSIITLLTEVKPYIPDQLLSQLMTQEPHETGSQDEDDEDGEAKALRADTLGSRYSHVRRRDRRQSASTAASSVLSSPRAPHSPKSPNPNVRLVRPHGRKGNGRPGPGANAADGAKPGPGGKDWTRRRCTYMCVRCGSTTRDAERRLREMARVVGCVVDIAKAHEATIDCVGVDFVTVHWGVSLSSNVSSTRAVHAALEIAKLRDTLPEDQQKSFWLQMGIGKGFCDCGTVSSESGHRFFVVWGAEASLAMEIASKELPQKVLAPLLVSAAVQQEVKYTVQCKPRLWHGDVLLWEPLCVQKTDENDEWMYELSRLDSQAVNDVCLFDLFQLAKDGNLPVADLEAQIAALKSGRSAALCPKDEASLDVLLASVRAASELTNL